MLARRLATIVPVMRLAEALETTRIPRVAGLTGTRTTVVTARPCRAPHHPIADVGLIRGARCPCRARDRGRTTARSRWRNGLSSRGTPGRGAPAA
jgi:predicted ATPase with chaperone activity